MRAALKTADGTFEVKEVETPRVVQPSDVLARVKAAGICGTDLRHWKVPDPNGAGKIVGHELSGEIVEVGEDVTTMKKGDRVVIETVLGDDTCPWCNIQEYNLCPNLYEVRAKSVSRAFAEYVIGPAKKFHKLPDNVSFEEAALLDTFSVSLHACHVTGLHINDRVAVIGAGPIGLSLLELAKASGADVLITDVLDFPLHLAEKLGADFTLNTEKEDGYSKVMDFTGKLGVDIAYECAGGKAVPTTVPQATSYTRVGGKLCFVGGFDSQTPALKMNWEHIQKSEIQLFPSASYSYWDIYPEIEMCINLLSKGKLDAKSLITHRYPLESINEAFTVASDKAKNNSVFVAILP